MAAGDARDLFALDLVKVACPLAIAVSWLERIRSIATAVLPVRGHLKQIPRKKRKFGMSGKNWDRVPIDAQSIDAPLSLAAVFLVVTVASEQAALAKVASVLGGLDDLVKTVGFRDLSGRLSCIAGIGRDLWDRLDSDRRPKELRPFAPVTGTAHAAVNTRRPSLPHSIRTPRFVL
jgi:hypothetical protein